ncbi:Murein DD-endopeptidase MepM and murein hydrolase activator NlpD, contain LysM domain [Hydrobacter penzbergensis]|uniref:Murein DD-endopeptidase MepM and murein hydrolase activator NlpD, contain LysM domain n=1 Tax=Hydrobacter penzbergensis TaxID=1235997 RepID=A0A8X8IEA3_9BACT|nr:M23 family metallopeptidase [Hydrobacter penzbergensis]SDW36146.1 Murein DD-endopeptidase MepM and murein hydrolase activator NlpD, contain LysM domain [Hydrobacter penzbergensis]
MKRVLLTTNFFFCMLITNAQTEDPAYKTIADQFEQLYNTQQGDSIFAMFSAEMQKALPIDKTNTFLSGLYRQAGKIKQREFTKYQSTFASYKTYFERALFAVNISVDDHHKINGFLVKPFVDEPLPKIDRNQTKLQLPFTGVWTVIWGGDTKEQNYHVVSSAQKNAFDIEITDEQGHSYKTDGQTNEDYYAFGMPLTAPCDGAVVLVVDGIKDNKPGDMNPAYSPGNSVIIKTEKNEYLVFAHFKQHSIQVTQDQKIKQGQLLGRCGNSGNSSKPHLHFHIQNTEDINKATGVKCYFDQIQVNGQPKTDYSPVKNDKISSPAL